MPQQEHCPAIDLLNGYLLDQLDDAEASNVEEHIEKCTACEMILQDLLDTSVRFGFDNELHRNDLESPPQLSNYSSDPIHQLGAGGFGVVWQMNDVRLNRPVAVKVMRFRDASKPSLVRRFLAEAQICSQLAHPSIVPVNDLGRLEDGRGYYVMKLVVGERLDNYFHESSEQFIPRIRVFQTICQAVAYAHDKRVIHRDLKPQNIMVGEHGEVQIMDWGLAKVLSDSTKHENPVRIPVVENVRVAADQTAATVLGTYAYMSPEQAAGSIEIEYRSDVFSLGAILCHLLTGKPPYVASQLQELSELARHADTSDAELRLKNCGADPRIIQIALRCLAENPADRPASGSEVAHAIRDFLDSIESELQEERIAREREQVQRTEEIRRLRFRNWVATAVGLLLIAGIVSGWNYWSNRAKARAQLEVDETETIQRAKDFIKQNQLENARNELLRFQDRARPLGVTSTAVKTLVADVDLTNDLQKSRARLAYNGLGFNNREVIDAYVTTFQTRGWNADDLPADAIDAMKNSPARKWILPHFDFLVGCALHCRVQANTPAELDHLDVQIDQWLAAARQLDPNQTKYPNLRNRSLWNQPNELISAVRKSLDQTWHWSLYDLMFDLLVLEDSTSDGVGLENLEEDQRVEVLALGEQLRRSALQRNEGDAWINYQLGTHLMTDQNPDNDEESARYLQAAIATDPTNPAVWSNYGYFHGMRGESDEALRCFQRAHEIDPRHFQANINLAAQYLALQDYSKAERYLDTLLEIAPNYATNYHLAGEIYRGQNNFERACKAYEKALELAPYNLDVRKALASTYHDSNRFLDAQQQWEKVLTAEPDYDEALVNLVLAHKEQKQYQIALDYFERIGSEKLVDYSSENCARLHDAVGMCYVRLDQLAESIPLFAKATEEQPQNPNYWINMGVAHRKLDNFEAARKCFRSVLEFSPDHEKAQRLLFELENDGETQGPDGPSSEKRSTDVQPTVGLPSDETAQGSENEETVQASSEKASRETGGSE